MIDEEAKFNGLCSHYKDTFDNHKETAKQRDTLFYSLLAVAAVFTLQISSIDTVTSVVDQYINKTIGINLGLNANFISTTLWLFLLGVTTKYFQKVVEIEGQYIYLHSVEEELNKYFGDSSKAFTREGRSYTNNYQVFSKWVGYLYTTFLPLILLVIVTVRIWSEFSITQKVNVNIIIDLSSFTIMSVTIVLYTIRMNGEAIKTLRGCCNRWLSRRPDDNA